MHKPFLHLALTLALVTACQETPEPLQAQMQVLIFGNSITYHAPSVSLGWEGNWGMAASDSTKDYAHLLKSFIQKKNPQHHVWIRGGASAFESNFREITIPDHYAHLRALKPDLLIIHLGENVQDEEAAKFDFERALLDLINFIRTHKHIPVVCVGSFWDKPNVNMKIEQVANTNNFHFVSLQSLQRDSASAAFGQYSHRAVASHPSDKGMRIMATKIWEEIEGYF